MVQMQVFRVLGAILTLTGLVGVALALPAQGQTCRAQSGALLNPVVELYTSEGCSSCPPADRWLARLRPSGDGDGSPVLQAFHVAYWDYIGWVDRFAHPAHTARQRQIAQWNLQRQIYTPQVVLNGRDWREWPASGTRVPAAAEPARATIVLQRGAPERYEAWVTMLPGASPVWGAYWTVTEQAHASRVQAGENAGEFLQHAHLVRQYTPVGEYRADPGRPQRLVLHAVAPTPGHARRINLVLFDTRSGRTLQALSLGC